MHLMASLYHLRTYSYQTFETQNHYYFYLKPEEEKTWRIASKNGKGCDVSLLSHKIVVFNQYLKEAFSAKRIL